MRIRSPPQRPMNIQLPGADLKPHMIERRMKREDFTKVDDSIICKGNIGQSQLVVENQTQSIFMMKIVPKHLLLSSYSVKELREHVKKISSLDHPHICSIKYYFEDRMPVILVSEYAENGKQSINKGNFEDLMNSRGVLSEQVAFSYFFQTLTAIDYLHSQGVIHQNLKLSNILLDCKGNVRLADFGWDRLGLKLSAISLSKNQVDFIVA